jgi:integrase
MREHGEGSISRERQRDGSIRFRPRLPVEGERQSLGLFDTLEEAEEALAAARELRGAAESGTTLRAWGEAWLTKREKGGRVRGWKKERACWKTHVAPSALAAMPLSRIRRVHVVTWLDALAAKEPRVARQTIGHARRLVIGALEAAIDGGRIDRNHARGARLPIRDESTVERWTWLTQDEIARVLALPIHDSRQRGGKGGRKPGHVTSAQRSAFIVAVYAGLRAGELWGLRWRDVILDERRPELVIRYSRDEATKSGVVRRVPLLAPARAALEAWKAVAPGVGEALVWPAEDGRCHRDGFDAGWARVRVLAEIEERQPRPRWHDLRHTCASHLVQGTWGRAWSLPEVRDFLGHGNIRVTERYAHLAPGGLHDAARATSATDATGQQVASVVDLRGRAVGENAEKDRGK